MSYESVSQIHADVADARKRAIRRFEQLLYAIERAVREGDLPVQTCNYGIYWARISAHSASYGVLSQEGALRDIPHYMLEGLVRAAESLLIKVRMDRKEAIAAAEDDGSSEIAYFNKILAEASNES